MANIYKKPYDKIQAVPDAGRLVEPAPASPAALSSRPRIGRNSPWLAPLAGHTDLVLRVLCRELGASASCTEMISAKGLLYGERGRKGHNATVELLRTLSLPGPDPAPIPPAGESGLGRADDGAPESAAFMARNARGAHAVRPDLLAAAGKLPADPGADSPLVVQLFGDDPVFLGQSVALLRQWGYEWFDLNLGCSVPKVTRAGAGAALARKLDKTLESARLMIAAAGVLTPEHGVAVPDGGTVRGRVGFKFRLGWSAEEENYLELAKGLEQCGAAWLTLHPRYARQGFSGSADWSALARLRRAVGIPVMASGDLDDAEAALRCLDETGVDGVMFARGALHNPAVFADYHELLNRRGTAENTAHARASLAPGFLKAVILRHAELAVAMAGIEGFHGGKRREGRKDRPEGALLKMRGAIPRYVKELPGSRAFRVAMSRCSSWPEFYALLDEFFDRVQPVSGSTEV